MQMGTSCDCIFWHQAVRVQFPPGSDQVWSDQEKKSDLDRFCLHAYYDSIIVETLAESAHKCQKWKLWGDTDFGKATACSPKEPHTVIADTSISVQTCL